VAASSADAQNNSLRRRGPQYRPPATQPASGIRDYTPPTPLAAAAGTTRATGVVNPVLLQASLIAFEPPEPRKIGVHDLVTIIVREDKRATSDSDLRSQKTWEIDASLKKWLRLDDNHRLIASLPQGEPGLEFELDGQYRGRGRVQRKDTLITRITAQVIDVKPNGTLVLEATKTIQVDEDVQTYTLTGVCRSEDVTAQNTILSTQLADAHITIRHTGPARDAARRGWLMRLLDLLRPF